MRETLEGLLEKRDGNLSMKEARNNGIAAATVQRMVREGDLQQVSKGFYIQAGYSVDELFYLQNRFSAGIFSHETALDIYQLSNNIPDQIHLTVSVGYHAEKEKLVAANLQIHYAQKSTFELGTVTGYSYQGNPIRLYDRERTLCDIWNPRYLIDQETRLTALKEYMADSSRDPGKLRAYMAKLFVAKEMNYYMQSLY